MLPTILHMRPLPLSVLVSRIGNIHLVLKARFSSSGDSKNNTTLSKFIDNFNRDIAANPHLALFGYLGIRYSTFLILSGFYGAFFPHAFGPEVGVGYLLAKFTGKFRQPANIVLAGALSKLFPILSQIKASALMGVLPQPLVEVPDLQKPSGKFEEMLVKLSTGIQKVGDMIAGPLDSYGFSFLVASKINVFLLVGGTSYAIREGFNVEDMMLWLSIPPELQIGAGAMGAAVLTNFFFLPFQFWALTKFLKYSPRFDFK